MANHDSSGEADAPEEDYNLARRTALGLIGAGSAGTLLSGGAAAQSSGGDGGDTSDRPWNRDVNAQGNDLSNLGTLDADRVRTESLQTDAREADVVVWKDDDGTWHADGEDGEVASGENVMIVTQQAIDEGLTEGRDWKEKVLIADPGTVGPHSPGDGPYDVYQEIRVPDYTILDIPFKLRVEDEGEPLTRPVYARGAEHIEFPRLNIEGNPRYAVWLQDVKDVHIGDMRIVMPADQEPRGGLGFRLDAGADSREWSEDVQVERAYIEEANWQAFETYTVRRLQVGEVLVNRTPGSGVLLNRTEDATIGQVVALEANPGGGYAGFRVANNTNDVSVGQVVARRCGRGVFAVSGCSNITVSNVNLVGCTSHGALLQDCQNFTIEGGVIQNSGAEGIRIDSRDSGGIPEDPRDFAATSGVTVSNVRIYDDRDDPEMPWGIRETGPDTTTSRIVNNDVRGSGTEGGIDVFSPSSMVRDNVGDGLDSGTVTLSSGTTPAARVEGVGGDVGQSLDLRARAASDPGDAFAYNHSFVWTGDSWDLVFEWDQDPGADLEVDYIVDQNQAEGFVPAQDDDGGSDGSEGVPGAADLEGDLVDSFEDGDLSEYVGATDAYEITSEGRVADGEKSLKQVEGGTQVIASTEGLPRYPEAGDTFFARVGRTDVAENLGFNFGMQDTENYYLARVYNTNRLQLYQIGGEGGGNLAEAVVSTKPNTLYTIRVDWGTDGTITLELLDTDGEVVGTATGESTEWTEGGVGVRRSGIVDDIRIQ